MTETVQINARGKQAKIGNPWASRCAPTSPWRTYATP
jgi:hypothetical protein